MKELIVTPLGTVAPYSKGEHNCPGFLVNYGEEKILLDCGNGITRLLSLPDDLKNSTIFISHLHPDHYGDLLSLKKAVFVNQKLGLINEKVKIYLPEHPKDVFKGDSWNSDGYKYYEKMPDAHFLDILLERESFDLEYYKDHKKVKKEGIDISFCKNPHDIDSYGIRLDTEAGSVVYSGDTGYKYNTLEQLAKDADLLICESTFLRGHRRDQDHHLYAIEAAEIAKSANVKQLMLTHFWPEIDKQCYLDEAKEVFENTIVAEEGKPLILRRSA